MPIRYVRRPGYKFLWSLAVEPASNQEGVRDSNSSLGFQILEPNIFVIFSPTFL